MVIGLGGRILSGSKGWMKSQFGGDPRPPSHSPFLGALQHQLVVTGHELELGRPLAHALQALPHRGHGPRRPAAHFSGPGLPLARHCWPGPGPHGLSTPPTPSVRRCPRLRPGTALSAAAAGAHRVVWLNRRVVWGASGGQARSWERAVSWSRTPVGRRAGLRRGAGAGAGARGAGRPGFRGLAQRPGRESRSGGGGGTWRGCHPTTVPPRGAQRLRGPRERATSNFVPP